MKKALFIALIFAPILMFGESIVDEAIKLGKGSDQDLWLEFKKAFHLKTR